MEAVGVGYSYQFWYFSCGNCRNPWLGVAGKQSATHKIAEVAQGRKRVTIRNSRRSPVTPHVTITAAATTDGPLITTTTNAGPPPTITTTAGDSVTATSTSAHPLPITAIPASKSRRKVTSKMQK